MCVKQIHTDPEILSMVERHQLSLGESTEIMANDFVMSSASSFCSEYGQQSNYETVLLHCRRKRELSSKKEHLGEVSVKLEISYRYFVP